MLQWSGYRRFLQTEIARSNSTFDDVYCKTIGFCRLGSSSCETKQDQTMFLSPIALCIGRSPEFN